MEGVSRVVYDRERDLREILHPKIIKELPKLERVLNLFHFLLHGVRSFSGSDVRLGYFFSSRHDFRNQTGLVEKYATGYSKGLYTRRTWAIVAYPLEEEARFFPRSSFMDGSSFNPEDWMLINDEDPFFFYRNAPQNHCSENVVFFFSRDPLKADEEYLREISKKRLSPLPSLS